MFHGWRGPLCGHRRSARPPSSSLPPILHCRLRVVAVLLTARRFARIASAAIARFHRLGFVNLIAPSVDYALWLLLHECIDGFALRPNVLRQFRVHPATQLKRGFLALRNFSHAFNWVATEFP